MPLAPLQDHRLKLPMDIGGRDFFQQLNQVVRFLVISKQQNWRIPVEGQMFKTWKLMPPAMKVPQRCLRRLGKHVAMVVEDGQIFSRALPIAMSGICSIA